MQKKIKPFPFLIITAVLLLIGIAVLLLKPTIKKAFYPIHFEELVETYSEKYGVDKYYVYAVIKTESDFKENAESHAGAMGLMQLMPDTANWMNEKYALGYSAIDLFDAETNINIGCCYIKYLSGKFTSYEVIAAAYNGGEGNVASWLKKYSSDGETLDKIPYRETENYVKKVMERYDTYKAIYS